MRTAHAASLAVVALLGAIPALQAQGTSLVPGATASVTNVGTRGANWLNIGIGARAQALGGSMIASAEGPSGLFWNPATIVSREGVSSYLSYMELYGNSGITNSAGALTIPIGSGAVGLSVQQFSSGEMERTTETSPAGGDATFGGKFTYRGTGAAAHYARTITDRFSAALGVRYVTEGIDVASTSYLGFDVATRFRTGLYGLTIGGAIMNIGSENRFRGAGIDRAITVARDNGNPTGRDLPVSFTTRNVQLPTTFRLGIQSSLMGDAESLLRGAGPHQLAVEGAFTDGIDGAIQPSFGAEYSFRQRAFLRGGKRFFNEADSPWDFRDGFSVGGGLRVPLGPRSLQLDYAFVTMGELQNNQVFSFDIAF